MVGVVLVVVVCSAAVAARAAAAAAPRSVMSLNEGWRFARTDATCPDGDDCCSGSGLPCQPAFDDAGWRRLSLPHDFVAEGPLVYANDSVAMNQGYRDYGKAWYRLAFSVPVPWRQQRRTMWLDFDGIAGCVLHTSKEWVC